MVGRITMRTGGHGTDIAAILLLIRLPDHAVCLGQTRWFFTHGILGMALPDVFDGQQTHRKPLAGNDARRPLCLICRRPQSACICCWVQPTDPAPEVLILQHPLEVHAAKGSARLLHLSLARSRLIVGESFDESTLRALLFAPADCRNAGSDTAAHSPCYPVLLYPATPDDRNLAAAPPFDPARMRNPGQIRLVVLDGTWRKSRKMLYQNPILQTLPRLPLADPPPSRYTIRKAHRPDQLSTLEATCHALIQLENANEKYQPLLHAFDGFVAQQSGFGKPGMDETDA